MKNAVELNIIGAGLAGSEAALQLAKRGFKVRLFDMKPYKRSPAHHQPHFAEIVCSNSFGSQDTGTASALLKQEMQLLDCELLQIAHTVAVPAGKALAVDRDAFSQAVTHRLEAEPLIEIMPEEVETLPENGLTLVATGPLTSPALVQALSALLEREQLYFFDAAAPIITRDSINFEVAFIQDRYATEQDEAPEGQSYINCPLEKDQYLALVEKLITSEKTELKSFEKESAHYFESCLPVEVLASRGPQTLRYGPMKPVGLQGPNAERRPYAVVQLRQDNAEGTLYNMVGFQTNLKWGAQKEMIQMIPGLEQAEIVRYGVMHRNTYLHSPEVLQPTLQLKKHPSVLIAGQLTGTEGYTESIATGLVAALNIAQLASGKAPLMLPRETMLGALLQYVTRPEAIHQPFQPINSNWGILPPLEGMETFKKRDKQQRNRLYAERAKISLQAWMQQQRELFEAN